LKVKREIWWPEKLTRALVVVLIVTTVGKRRRSFRKKQPAAPPVKEPRARRVNFAAAATMLILSGLLGGATALYWPDTSGPARGLPTIAGAAFSVDKPDINGGVRISINPDTATSTGGPPRVIIAVDLNVPKGEVAQWALDFTEVSSAISLTEDKLPASSNSGHLIEAPQTYTLPSPIGNVRDYLLAGQVVGPSSAYSQLMSSSAELPGPSMQTSLTEIAWSGPLPAIFQGAYVTVSMPSLISAPATSSGGGFSYSWKSFPLRKFHAVEELDLSGDYQIDSGSQTSNGYAGWTWTSDANPGIVNATGYGSSVSLQAGIQRRSFEAGILAALAVSALFAAIQFYVTAATASKRQSGKE
jgi:hypothetical protein